MRVRLVTGSFPPEVCGVGDYTKKLAEALQSKGVDANVSILKRIVSPEAIRIAYERKDIDEIVHIQYPSVGYGHGIVSQVISLVRPCLVTLHELSKVHPFRKMASLPFLCRSDLLFTTQFELDYAMKAFPALKGRCKVIPIGSNVSPTKTACWDRATDVIYFGLIVPKKGLESILELADLLRVAGDSTRIRVVGATVPRFQTYADAFISRCVGLPIMLSLNEPEWRVAELLGNAKCAYLPFPDGASDRRGSLKALMAAGVPCITTAGTQTTRELANAICVANNAREAFRVINEVRANEQRWLDLSYRSLNYAKTYDWGSIADRHIQLYKRLVERRHLLFAGPHA